MFRVPRSLGTTLDSEMTIEQCIEEAQLEYMLLGSNQNHLNLLGPPPRELPCMLEEGSDTAIRRFILHQLSQRAMSFSELHGELVKNVLHVNLRKKTLGYLIMKLKQTRVIVQVGPFYRFNPRSELAWELVIAHGGCFSSDEPVIFHETATSLLHVEESLQRVISFLVTPLKPSGTVKAGKISGLSLFLIEYLYDVKQREHDSLVALFGHMVKDQKSIYHFLRTLENLNLVSSDELNGQLIWKIKDNDDVKLLYHSARLHEKDLWCHTMGRPFIVRRLMCYEHILRTKNSALMTDYILENLNNLLDLVNHVKHCLSGQQ